MGTGLYFEGAQMFWNEIEVVVAHHFDRTECHCLVHFKVVKFILCEVTCKCVRRLRGCRTTPQTCFERLGNRNGQILVVSCQHSFLFQGIAPHFSFGEPLLCYSQYMWFRWGPRDGHVTGDCSVKALHPSGLATGSGRDA